MASQHPRVLFLVHALGGGGAERVTVNLANYLADAGWPTYLLPLQIGGPRYPVSEKVQLDDHAPQGGNKYVRGFKKMRYVHAAIDDFKPDVVVSLGAGFGYLTTPGIRHPFSLVTQIATDPTYLMSKSRFDRITYKRAFERSARIVFQTQGAMDYFDQDVRRKGVIISNPLRDGLVHNDLPFIERDKEVVTFGRLVEQKSFDVLIDAFAEFSKKNPEYTLSIFGEGALERELQAQIDRLNLSSTVKLAGFRDDVHDRIRNAAMYVLSSNVEGLPNAMLEAMALGIPSVCTDCDPGGARETIERFHSGVLVPKFDAPALAAAMDALVHDPQRADAYTQAGLEVAAATTGARIYREWAEIIAGVAAAR